MKRCEQFSVKVTEDACRRFRQIAEERGVTLGVLFEHALDALERECPRAAGGRHNASLLSPPERRETLFGTT